jgi:hypothetical protein
LLCFALEGFSDVVLEKCVQVWLFMPIRGRQQAGGREAYLGALLFQGLSQVIKGALDGKQLALEELAQRVAVADCTFKEGAHLLPAAIADAK